MHRIFPIPAMLTFEFLARSLSGYVLRGFGVLAAAVALMATPQQSVGQGSSGLLETGQVSAGGKQVRYQIRRLPVNTFPNLPASVASALTARGCLIPQTYGAHGPENVIHGSFERVGEIDWAVLCSSGGRVSLLVFLASGSPNTPLVLQAVEEASRLQQDEATGQLGFDWGIDTATPKRVHDGEAGMTRRPPAPDHDCIADSTLDRAPTYRCLQGGKWVAIDTQ